MGRWWLASDRLPQGQGHETTAAQVVADVLGISPDLVKVKPGFDTEQKCLHRAHRDFMRGQFCGDGIVSDSWRGGKTSQGDVRDWRLGH